MTRLAKESKGMAFKLKEGVREWTLVEKWGSVLEIVCMMRAWQIEQGVIKRVMIVHSDLKSEPDHDRMEVQIENL